MVYCIALALAPCGEQQTWSSPAAWSLPHSATMGATLGRPRSPHTSGVVTKAQSRVRTSGHSQEAVMHDTVKVFMIMSCIFHFLNILFQWCLSSSSDADYWLAKTSRLSRMQTMATLNPYSSIFAELGSAVRLYSSARVISKMPS